VPATLARAGAGLIAAPFLDVRGGQRNALGLDPALRIVHPAPRIALHFRWPGAAVPKGKVKDVATMLTAIHAQEDRREALAKARSVVHKLRQLKLKRAAELLEKGVHETASYSSFPREHWRHIKTNNPLERILR